MSHAKKIHNKRTELTVVGVPLAEKNVWKAAELRQNLVENSIGVVGGERGNSLARAVAEAGNAIIVIYLRN